MEHTEIRRNLSAYLDDAVSSEAKTQIEAHLAGCASCRGALADLERTVAHLKSLPEVEPPPWLTAKIMAQVRGDAEKKPGIWQRFFLPFQVKLPLQAFALLFLCVTGYYLARINAPLLDFTPPASREEAPVPAPAPAQAPAQARTPALPQMVESKPQLRSKPTAAPKDLAPGQRSVSKMPSPAGSSQQLGTFSNAPGAATKKSAQPKPSAEKAPAPQMTQPARTPASLPKEDYQAQAPGSDARSEAVGSPGEAERVREGSSRRESYRGSQKMAKGKAKASGGPEFSANSFDAAPPGAASRGGWTEQPPPQESERRADSESSERVEVTLRVGDPEGAVQVIEKAVTRHGGRIVRRSYGESSHLLLVRMETAKVPKLMERLVQIGTPSKAPKLPTGDTGSVELAIRW